MAALRPSAALRSLAQATRPRRATPAPALACCSTAAPSSSSATVAAAVRPFSTSRAPREAAAPTPAPSPSSSSFSPPPSRASYDSAPSNPNSNLFAPSPAAQLSYLQDLLAPLEPLPNQHLIERVLAERALTHKSGVEKGPLRRRDGKVASEADGGRNGHNEKLSFVGRRLLRLHLTLHLHTRLSTTHPSLLSNSLSQRALDAVLNTKQLGATVGAVWRLEDAMRWREVRGPDGMMTGLWKIRGMGVEAIVGAAFTTQGIETSSRLFHQLILPHLDFPRALQAALDRKPVTEPIAEPAPAAEASA
ncbi:hypothetical protein JCM5296_000995 [Sporobolomyces johnsonii]